MRRMIWTFIFLSPVISIVQTDHAVLTVSGGKQLAKTLVASAAVHVASVVHTIHILFT